MRAGFAVARALRPRSEEDEGRVEALLATGLSRPRWLLAARSRSRSSARCSVVAGAAGLGLGVGYALVDRRRRRRGGYTVATVPYVVPVLVLARRGPAAVRHVAAAGPLAWLVLGFAASCSCSASCSRSRSGCRSSRRSSTWRWSRPRTSGGRRSSSWRPWPRPSARPGRGVHASRRRGPLASSACGSPSPVGTRCPAAGPSTFGVWGAVEGGRTSSSSGSRRPGRRDPPSSRDPRHSAYWRRAADVALAGVVAATPGLRGRRVVRGRGGRRRDHPGARAGRGRAPAACSSRRAWAGSPAPSWAAPVAGQRPAARPAGPGRAARRLADAGADPVADVADHLWRRREAWLAAGRAAAGAAARRPGGGQPAGPRRGRRGRDRLVARSGTGRSGPTSATSSLPRARSSSRCSTPTWSACPTGWPPGAGGAGGARSRRSTPRSPARTGRWPGSPGERARWRASSATRPSRRTCGACSASSPDRVPARPEGRCVGSGSELVGREGVAGLEGAVLVAGGEPAHPLLGGAVRPLLGVDAAAGLLLDPVVADGLGRVDAPR